MAQILGSFIQMLTKSDIGDRVKDKSGFQMVIEQKTRWHPSDSTPFENRLGNWMVGPFRPTLDYRTIWILAVNFPVFEWFRYSDPFCTLVCFQNTYLTLLLYSNPPNTQPSGFRMVIPRTQFVSGFWIASLDRFIVKKIFYSCQNGLG
jgi:hypothetical protein